jgi:hypothetical protein
MRYLGRCGWVIVPCDSQEGMKWLRRAVAHGSEGAQHNLAEMLIEGTVIPADLAEGIDWLRKAAAQGCPRAQFELAQQYACGNGDPRDASETPVVLLSKAAKAGWGEAQFVLGERYRIGLGVETNRVKAFFWYDSAASNRIDKAAQSRDKLRASLSPEDHRQLRLWSEGLEHP